MALIAKQSTGGGFEPIGLCTTAGRCCQVIDLGVHDKIKFGTTDEVELASDGRALGQHKVFVTFELPSKTISIDGKDKPRWISKEMTLSAHEKAAMPKFHLALTGKDEDEFDLSEWLDKPCLIQIGATSSGKDKIVIITSMIEGMDVAPLSKPALLFDIEEPDMDAFAKFPKFIQEKITSAKNWKGAATSEPEDDTPF